RSGEKPARRRRHQRAIALLAGSAPEPPPPQPVRERRHAPYSSLHPSDHRGPRGAPATELCGEAHPIAGAGLRGGELQGGRKRIDRLAQERAADGTALIPGEIPVARNRRLSSLSARPK